MACPPKFNSERPDEPRFRTTAGVEVAGQPIEERQTPNLVLATLVSSGATGSGVLPVSINADARREDRPDDAYLGAKHLVIVHPSKCLFISSDLSCNRG